ncbi:TonB-dependent receptor [Chitinophaga rhizosphaerae]|uniref:TonB-dependent receptor n=1 Tax=Chitinophaga rhizosphaerae TaxID=1864947 RepID=UPI000F80AAFE|nr:TonB-dependent receptor [Chitinophaga rhizosphaerae]
MKVCRQSICWLATLLVFLCQTSFAQQQQTINGTVLDATTQQALPGVTVSVKGANAGAVTNANGEFSVRTTHKLPLTLVFSYVGYSPLEQTVTDASIAVNVQLSSTEILGQEVVVSANRSVQSALESPVSIEKIDSRAIKAIPAPTFYDALANMKGVELSTQSLTFKSVNSRGFNSNGNTRMLQLIDGMDNQAPGLNFSVGNIVGITELDMDNVEVLPGAASALYGPNALNGIVLLNSKSPFQYQGLSAIVKSGILSESGRSKGTTGYYDVAVRYAKAFNDKFAFKINLGYIKADDWQAYDDRDQSLLNGFDLKSGNRSNPGYNGVNIYGDETNVNMFQALKPTAFTPGNPLSTGIAQLSAATNGLITPDQIYRAFMPDSARSYVSRTGYNERDLADYDTKNLKANVALHYKINSNLELLAQGSYGTGTTVYTGADRYSIKNFRMGQYKIELRSDNFYVRAYTTQERSGDSYAVGTLGAGINEAWSPSAAKWFPEYFGTYATQGLTAFSTAFQQALGAGQSPAQAFGTATAAAKGGSGGFHDAARKYADRGRLLPGSKEFEDAANKVKDKPIPGDANGVGAKFMDKTNLYQGEFMYNFKNQISFMELMVGGNYRVYALNSEKTIFALDDNGKEFRIHEYGGYVQVGKRLLEERLKLSAALRYDKNENFEGQFSPRLSAVYTFLKTHNIRASFQTGFRIPHTQDQYIDLLTPQARLLGGLPFLRERYGLNGPNVFSLESIQAGAPKPYTFREFKPEKVEAFELGYKALISGKLLIDAYVYTNTFKNFNGSQVLVKVTAAGQEVYSVPVNYEKDLKSWGWALGLDYRLPANFTVGGNVSYNKLRNEDELGGFQAMYNTPRYRYNLNFGNRNVAQSNFGFNISWRWQEAFVWSSSFVGPLVRVNNLGEIPAYGALDAQVSYLFPKPKVTLKIGGANITGKQYIQSWGNPMVGTQAYASIGYNL